MLICPLSSPRAMARVHEDHTRHAISVVLGTSKDLKAPFVQNINTIQGMFGMNIKQEGISIDGDKIEFARWTHIWRRVLELVHDAHAGETPADQEPEVDEDHIVGRYVYLKDVPLWGKCKVFYEMAGEGDQDIVFLHTAGSDSRQYHGVLNDERMRKKCRMIAFDLPVRTSWTGRDIYAMLTMS